ncbi:phage protein [Bifidobacterium saguini DSM 23967]|uniref:Phage protein n=2 Tax=Bifidobacterium saguini TaxID=762210 RepID=A0A087DAB2_9BIFI|nr:hypothetical protein [Bifidobacterium saguini]KFI92462.1 phage protein [Bifidobacterium saguini DSM 23967]QTB90812.1 hypothetical protein BSD967_11095 [Bifidobacterium saguini]QTB90874.1 hypothetical protein BSD967_11430 [Bifidobacterium saguini]
MANPAKAKGTALETWTVRYLAWALQDTRIDRMPLKGNHDQGDLTGVMFDGMPVCVECKDTKQPQYRKHWRELKVEMANMDTTYGVLVQHRKGVGVKSLKGMARQMAVMDVNACERLLAGCKADDRFKELVRASSKPVPQNPTLVWMPLELFARILNHGLPLGPE